MKRAAVIALTASAASAALAAALSYPEGRRVEQTDVYHGQRVGDPYRWLEDTGSAETRSWIEAQNALTRSVLDPLADRAWFAARVRALMEYERFGLPKEEGGRFVYRYNAGHDEQDSLWVTDDPAQRGRLLLDPVALRPDGTVSLGDHELAPDGRHLAYALSDGGSDWKTWRIRDVPTGTDLPETLVGTKFTEVSWARDGRAFYYSRYPAKDGGGYDDGRQVAIWKHALGSEQARDVPVFSITDDATRDPYPAVVTEDGAYLVIRVEEGYQTNALYYLPLAKAGGEVVRLLDAWDALYEFLGNDGPVFYVKTTNHAPRGRIVAIDLRKSAPEQWREVVPEAPEAIAAVSFVGGRLIVQYIVDVKSRVKVFEKSGRFVREVALPGAGDAEGFEGPALRPETFFSYTDFMTPRAVYRYDVKSGRTAALRPPAAGIPPEQYVTRQVRYRSRDGTEIPMYIVHRRDVAPDGRRPTVLYGYGGFNVSLLPAFSAGRAAWLETGGVYAVANLRGGGEFGEAWHEAGTKARKQNVFDDFIAAAEWLISERYTSAGHLAIWGASNGGLLIGAVLNQRPDLFAAALPGVGVMDMLRYQLASANAKQWSSDYGLADVPEEFRALYAYSPYHNIHAGTCYPPTLVLADANDDRVAAWHSYKYAAALQNAQACDKPVLVRIETRSGHGAGASTSKIVDEYADQWAFAARYTGLTLPATESGRASGASSQ